MIYIIVGILLFGVLIAVHEGGHFVSAKLLGVRVNEFAIGMGPLLFSKTYGETQYSLRLLPLGGYCAMEGEDEDSEDPRAFSNKAPWRKLIILAAGSGMNLVAGFLLAALLFVNAGSFTVPVLEHLEDIPAAGASGLQEGDRILRINGQRVWIYNDVIMYLNAAAGKDVDVQVVRGGEKILLKDLPLQRQTFEENRKTVQRYGLRFQVQEATFPAVMKQSFDTCCYFGKAVWQGLGMLVSGQVGLKDMSGPVGIVSYLGEAGEQGGNLQAGLQNVVYIIALVAVNLAIMNLLPIPALDGGRIFLLLVSELVFFVTRRRMDGKYEAYLHAAGFALLMLFMAVVTFSDVFKLFQ